MRTNVIGRSFVIIGEVSCEEDLAVEGQVDGQISVRGAAVEIGPEATVAGDVRGGRVLVHGTVQGNIAASARIELMPSAAVHGSLSANQVVVADGARFTGRIDMDRRTISAKVAQFKAGSQAAVAGSVPAGSALP